MMHRIVKDGRTLPFVIKHKSIKHTTIRLSHEGVVVHASKSLPTKVIITHLEAHFDRLYARWEALTPPERDDEISLWGKTYQLIVTKGHFKYSKDDTSVIAQTISSDIKDLKKRIWKEELREWLSTNQERIKATIEVIGLEKRPYRIKYLKSKYGSYHRHHDEITLNSYLARLEERYAFYVLMHEYAHVLVFNHSKAFYQVLDRLMPGHKEIQKQLKRCAIID